MYPQHHNIDNNEVIAFFEKQEMKEYLNAIFEKRSTTTSKRDLYLRSGNPDFSIASEIVTLGNISFLIGELY